MIFLGLLLIGMALWNFLTGAGVAALIIGILGLVCFAEAAIGYAEDHLL